MNPLNYGSLEACKRLVDNGIVLETDLGWYKIFRPGSHEFDMVLSMRSGNEKFYGDNYPAPSMAEVWRELPETIDEYDLTCEKIFNGGIQAGYTTCDVSGLRWRVLPNAANPTDALIDLLIWVRQQGKED